MHNIVKESVFVAIFCRYSKPFIEYTESKKYIDKVKEKNIPWVLLISRWDGTIGFPGGTVDHLYSISENAKRELKEELNYIPSEVCFVDSYILDSKKINFYSVEVNYDEFLSILKSSVNSLHYGTEILTAFPVPLYDYGDKKGILNIMKHNMIGNVKNDLIKLIEKYSLMDSQFIKLMYNNI